MIKIVVKTEPMEINARLPFLLIPNLKSIDVAIKIIRIKKI